MSSLRWRRGHYRTGAAYGRGRNITGQNWGKGGWGLEDHLVKYISNLLSSELPEELPLPSAGQIPGTQLL